MYLNRLNNEQKDLFLDICIHASLVNNNFDDKEKEIIQQYCDEMRLPSARYTANKNFEAAAERLIEISSDIELRIIALEITALLISDNIFDEFEKKFMDSFAGKIQLDHDQFDKILTLLNTLAKTYEEINEFVFQD